ncbi:MAG TPA: DUF6600 domain-containing protein, partial [Luteolibacter sp.]
MKPHRFLSFAALAAMALSGCDKRGLSEAERADLERKSREADDRASALEKELELQKLANERDALDRERARLEEMRADLERKGDEAVAADAERLRKQEADLQAREESLKTRQEAVDLRDQYLDDREIDLAGREALPELDPTPDFDDAPPVSDYNVFYNSLADDGSWFETPDYGYVFQPTIVIQDRSWRPYTRGRWACSNRGWMWISDERFGWACYHYGRWALISGRGWVWIPGDEWAPSWVSWRNGGDYVGWAPLPPESLGYRRRSWGTSVEVELGIGSSWFTFVSIRNFGGPIRQHCLPYTQNNTYIRQTTNITNITYQNNQFFSGGPSYRDLNRRIGRQLPFYQLNLDRYD